MTALSTKEKIIELGRSFIQQVGYHSFNYKQIATELNIKNAAVHHYYPSKEDLGLAVINKDAADFKALTQRVESVTPTQRIDAFIHNYKQYFYKGHKLCLIGTFGSCYNDMPQKIQTGVSHYLDLLYQWLTDTLKAGQESGEFKLQGTPEQTANMWIATLPGLLQVGRLRGADYLNQMMADLVQSIK